MLKGLRRKLVVMKYTLQRGYSWLNVAMLSLIGAGVLKPYFPNWNIFYLGAAAFIVIFIAGLLDKYIGLLHEEANYGIEVTPLLMKGLKGELSTNTNKEEKKDENKLADSDYIDLTKPKLN